MFIFFRPQTDPYFNIAAEEYFVKNATDDLCMIWMNEQSVIIGKHQNAYAEINYPFAKENGIPLIRRISGGGAVYHDQGNINFTFIQKTDKSNQIAFKRFTEVIIDYFKHIGIEVNVNARNSILIGDRKISGHAEHIFHDRVLHHGTLLFDTDLDALEQSLTPFKEFAGKGMPSVRSKVRNIKPYLTLNWDIFQFIQSLIDFLNNYYPHSKPYQLQTNELDIINKLAETKYKSWQWNFGYSPAYTFQVKVPFLDKIVLITSKVENGKFVQIDIPSENDDKLAFVILQNLIGIMHKEEEIDSFVKNNLSGLELAGINTVIFREAFFK